MMRNGHWYRALNSTNNASTSCRRCVRMPTWCSRPDLSNYGVLGLTPIASKSDVKQAYKRLALKYHPDVYKGDDGTGKNEAFKEIKAAYESLMQKFEEDDFQMEKDIDECEEWEDWMGFEGGIPVVHHPF